MTRTVLEQRVLSSAGDAHGRSPSDTPPIPSITKLPYTFVIAGAGIASLAGSPASAATPPPPHKHEDLASKLFLTSQEYVSLESRLMSIYTNNVTALAALNSRMDEIATVVALLVRNQAQTWDDELSHTTAEVADAATLLNRACDEGVFDPAVKVLAERELASTDRFSKLAAIRTIALMDRQRGQDLIEAELSKEESAVIRGALEGILRAIA